MNPLPPQTLQVILLPSPSVLDLHPRWLHTLHGSWENAGPAAGAAPPDSPAVAASPQRTGRPPTAMIAATPPIVASVSVAGRQHHGGHRARNPDNGRLAFAQV
jgi:hypothetical protein